MREMQIRQTVKLGKLAEKCCMIETSVSKEGSGCFFTKSRHLRVPTLMQLWMNVNSLAIGVSSDSSIVWGLEYIDKEQST